MLITIISIILALLMTFYSEVYPLNPDFYFLAIMMIIGGTTLLILTLLLGALSLIPLQKMEHHFSSKLIELFRRDRPLRLAYLLLFLFPFISYMLATALIIIDSHYPHKMIIFAIWMVALGVALDLIRDTFKRTTNFLNPFHLIDLFSQEAKKAIQNGEDENLWRFLDSLSEAALRAIEDSKIALTIQALNAFPPIVHRFFASSKSIGHLNQDKEIEKKTGQDEASYTIFYLLQRLQAINIEAVKHQSETVCSHLIVVMGKIIVECAKFDLSMVSFPTHFLGRFALTAQEHHLDEIANIATSTLLEISKIIVTEIDVTYMELEEPFQTIINCLDDIAKALFKKDKTMNIKFLSQSLKDLRQLFQSEKMAKHRDTPIIIQKIDDRLAEFEILEQVMRTIPPIQ